MTNRRTRRARGDDGMVLIFVALLMVAMMVMVAIVIDLGRERANQRADATVSDLAALAAGYYLSGHGSGSAAVANPQAACYAAYNSATTNVPAFSGDSSVCNGFPTNATACSTASPLPGASEVSISGGGYTLTIRYPVPSSELSDPYGKYSAPLANDGTDAGDVDRCQRMRTTFTLTDNTAFAGIIGQNQLTTSATSVVRGSTSQTGQGVAALLLLERVGCGSLQNSGQGSVLVQAPDATHPGVIQADSAGQVGPCTTNNNSGGYVIYGPQLPAASGGGPSIVAQNASGGQQGIIGIYSLTLSPQGRGGAVFPLGLSVAPTGSVPASRQPVDDKYNGASTQITSLQNRAFQLADSATAPDATWTTLSSNAECNGTLTAAQQAAQKVFINCFPFEPKNANVTLNATQVVVHGYVTIKNSEKMSLPNVRDFFIRGCDIPLSASGCSGSTGNQGLTVAGELYLNTGEAAIPSSFGAGVNCASRTGPGAGGSTTNWSELVTFSGTVSVTGSARMCQTFVYMSADESTTYGRKTVVNTGISPENYPAVAGCTASVPCPKNGVEDGSVSGVTNAWFFSISGGGAVADWTAPNQFSVQPKAAEFATSPFEDLSLWSETSSTSVALKGQGSNLTEGVYFLPNASATFTGQGSAPITLNAQFLIRNLNMSGQGQITLSPNPADAVIFPLPGSFALIR